MNRAESGVGDSVPFFVRIGEKGSRNLLRSDLWSLAVPGRMSLCVLDTVEENAYRQCGKWAGLSAPVKSLVFAAMRCRDGLANAFCSKVPQSADSP